MADSDPNAPATARGGTATATKSGSGSSTPRLAPRPRKPPPKIHTKASAGKLILLGLLALAMLFGIGYAAGQAFTGGSTESVDGTEVELSKDCEIVDTVPSYPPPSDITVLVLNAGSPPGSATTTGEQLTSFGFVVSGIDDGAADATTPSVIQHGPEARMAVQTLKAYLQGEVTLQEFPDAGNNVTLLLREGFPGVATAEQAQAILSTPVPTPTGPGCTPEDMAKVPATTQG